MNKSDDDSSVLSEDSDVAFAFADFAGVNFDDDENKDGPSNEEPVADESNKVQDENTNQEKSLETNQDLVSSKDVKLKPTQAQEANQALVESVQSIMNQDDGEQLVPASKLSAQLDTISYPKVSSPTEDLTKDAEIAIKEEKYILMNDCYLGNVDEKQDIEESNDEILNRIRNSSNLLAMGDYIEVLNSVIAQDLFQHLETCEGQSSVVQQIRHCVLKYCTSVSKCVEVELFAAAALNLFMQSNYTGPSLHHGGLIRPGKEENTYETLELVNPHPVFASDLKVSESKEMYVPTEPKDGEKMEEPPADLPFHNAVLAELSVDGEWPCPVAKYPYFLLLARSILATLAQPNRPDWSHYLLNDEGDQIVIRKTDTTPCYEAPSQVFVSCSNALACSSIWSGRAIVAHSRLLQGDEPAMTLWKEAKATFDSSVAKYCTDIPDDGRSLACKVFLEYGLAEHHFDKEKMGKPLFYRALEFSGLDVEVTGAEGRRTKYQQKATAQYLVKAKPTSENKDTTNEVDKDKIEKQEIKFEEDTILLDKVKYVEDDNNVHFELNLMQQTVLLALCLDVKNDNPMDGLTGEQMGAYLERVLQQHDDWMVYASGLLERAWLESERNHTRERALLQLQALADQHTNRLTLTQSTFKAAVEDSAPPQERLRNIHYIVYPPRWGVLRDLAERYAKIGIVTSAAEIFEEIELWDEVVECYRRAGKEKKAEEIVRKRLTEAETPRMWAALGDITGDKSHYEKALEVSNGKFSSAHVALGQYYHDKGQLKEASDQFKMALQIKPLTPQVWFTLGAISMRLDEWETALQAFTEVVQQEPEEGDAWANVAAIHMHNKNPGEAYPALNEVSSRLNIKLVDLQNVSHYFIYSSSL